MQNAAALPPDFCSITQHTHLYPALLQALWQIIRRLSKISHFRSLFQPPICAYAQEYDYETACIANGKPYFKEHENLHFNLSHSGNFAVCIVAGMPCGIDIEGNRPFKPSVAKRFFSKTEYHWIYDTENVSVQAERFFRLWTLKEAYAKATGNGIAAEIYAASYVPDTDSDGLFFADSETAAHFQIKEAEYDGLRIAAVLSDSAFLIYSLILFCL